MRRSTIFTGILAILVGLILFRVKYEVVFLEQQQNQIRKSIIESEESIHVLKAEWAHLNDPKYLQDLAQRYLDLSPIQGSQLISLKDVTLKAPTPSIQPPSMDNKLPDNKPSLDNIMSQIASEPNVRA
jgi:hypothetical protein